MERQAFERISTSLLSMPSAPGVSASQCAKPAPDFSAACSAAGSVTSNSGSVAWAVAKREASAKPANRR